MHHDVHDLRKFYYSRAMGRVVQRVLRDRLISMWPPELTQGMTVLGYGFAAPLLRPYLTRARRVSALMPGPQGVMAWPAGLPNCSVLCEELAWPVDTGSVDRLVLLHALETADQPAALMDECWRVLGPGGRMLIMVPNRAGLWARSETTPFGFGRSYTAGQLEAQARAAGFVAERTGAALYTPPFDRRFWLRSAQMWERIGLRVSQVLVAGVVLIEFSKHVPAPIGRGRRVSVPSPLDVLEGIARPRPAGQGAGRIARDPS
ncbi:MULTISPECIES: class I SAM-dependent methyltransferase [unclassified Paracoccus (in: a-proteobacteria)]|uniref:class I SAM-dependent methyltransferase n=1 Tax=unclassified Paracoccus (in: a-proteobacteria) TaxID=2688777 RepID=UPI0012B2E6AA|nr:MULTISPECIES: methyltransferase domain-containing protein [unclassified Paracoccus (in: a-proteobacteria)]UXU74805.1 class I SAM-dependent methyltransferase [Paracoccus sp. SMMA_5]UXU80702.1 class I SAM-dependent methyltransferase [Paracoccus sp. SMMA_5_TC]